MLSTVLMVYYGNCGYCSYFLSNRYQNHRLLIVVIKEYHLKEKTLSSFDSADTIYQAGKISI